MPFGNVEREKGKRTESDPWWSWRRSFGSDRKPTRPRGGGPGALWDLIDPTTPGPLCLTTTERVRVESHVSVTYKSGDRVTRSLASSVTVVGVSQRFYVGGSRGEGVSKVRLSRFDLGSLDVNSVKGRFRLRLRTRRIPSTLRGSRGWRRPQVVLSIFVFLLFLETVDTRHLVSVL